MRCGNGISTPASDRLQHAEPLPRRHAESLSSGQLQRPKDVVVVADHPPEFGATQISRRQNVNSISLDHRVEVIVGPRGCFDLRPAAEELERTIAELDDNGVTFEVGVQGKLRIIAYRR